MKAKGLEEAGSKSLGDFNSTKSSREEDYLGVSVDNSSIVEEEQIIAK